MQIVKHGLQGWLWTKSCRSRLMMKRGRQLLKTVRQSFQEAAKLGFRAHGHTGAERLARLAAHQVLELGFLVSVFSKQGGCSLVMSLLMVKQHSLSMSSCQAGRALLPLRNNQRCVDLVLSLLKSSCAVSGPDTQHQGRAAVKLSGSALPTVTMKRICTIPHRHFIMACCCLFCTNAALYHVSPAGC